MSRAILLVSVLFLSCSGDPPQKPQVDAEFARIRAAKEPLTYADLAAMTGPVSGDQGVTQAWLDAVAHLHDDRHSPARRDLPIIGSGGAAPPPGDPWPEIEKVESFLSQERKDFFKALDRVDKSGGQPRFPIPWSDGPGMMFPHIESLREAVLVLMLDARIKAHRNDVAGVLRDLRIARKAVNAISQDPIMLSMLARCAMQLILVDELRIEMGHLAFDDADLARFGEELREDSSDGQFRLAFLGERVWGIEMFQGNFGKEKVNEGDVQDFIHRNREPFLRYLSYMREAIEIGRHLDVEAYRAVEKLSEKFSKENRSKSFFTSTEEILKSPESLLGVLSPALQRSIQKKMATIAILHCAEAATAVIRFARAQGVRPEKLEDLVPKFLPAVPIDPFSGKALRYRQEAESFTLYSIGEDFKDDGGVPRKVPPGEWSDKEEEDFWTPDLVYRVATPPKK